LTARRARISEPGTWVPVSGTRGVELYAFINKPSLITSNAFLMRTSCEIILIDPGASVEQKDQINQILRDLVHEQPRPILVVLTHCHHDHSCYVGAVALDGGLVKRLGHERTIDALRRGDRALTLADLYPNAKVSDANFDVALFRAHTQTPSAPAIVALGQRGRLSMFRDTPETGDGTYADRQILRLGTGDDLEFYYTPGHSPDHLAIRLGGHLFLGDLPFAADPGLAGLPGWDARALAGSIANMTWLIENAMIEICHAGHGRSLPASTMRQVLAREQREAGLLKEITEINRSRVATLKAHAHELLEVASDMYAVIAGRILSTARRLELLEEPRYADRFRTAVDLDGVERALDDLRRFCINFGSDMLPELSTVLKCVQVMRRLEAALVTAGELAGAALTGRTARLLDDFFNAVRGLRITNAIDVADVNDLAATAIRTLRARPLLDEVTTGAGADDDTFARSLARRLAFVDILRNVDVEVIRLDGCAMVTTDAQRIIDVLTDAVELLAASGARHIALRVTRDCDWVAIEVRQHDLTPRAAIDRRRQQVYRRILAIGGSSLRDYNERAITVMVGRSTSSRP
jgi:glyoxylase-like metal-dependent hydrolase (beta-lactamase superfamily II)